MTLDELQVGQGGRIALVGGEGALRRRLLDMGVDAAHLCEGAQGGAHGGPHRADAPGL